MQHYESPNITRVQQNRENCVRLIDIAVEDPGLLKEANLFGCPFGCPFSASKSALASLEARERGGLISLGDRDRPRKSALEQRKASE